MNIVKLNPFGVEISDFDLSKMRTAEETAQLLALFNEHYILVFRGQDISDDDHLRVFHDMFPGEDLGDESGTGNEVSYVSNVRPDGVFGDGPLTFHSDFSFTTDPTRLISLYGSEVDPGSSPTEFSNGELALHVLSPELRAYLNDKQVVSATDLISVAARLPSYNLPGVEDLSGRTHEEVCRAAWPVILNHPRTGRPLVYVNEQHAHHLQGIPLAEGRKVLEEICGILYRPDHIYSHDWKQGDLVLWDNIALSHGRRATSGKTAKRSLRRVRGGGATRVTMRELSQSGIDQSENYISPELQRIRRTLGGRIRDFRMARKWTQRELSDATAINFQNIGQYEIGIWMPSGPEIETIARSLGIDHSQLVEGLDLTADAAA